MPNEITIASTTGTEQDIADALKIGQPPPKQEAAPSPAPAAPPPEQPAPAAEAASSEPDDSAATEEETPEPIAEAGRKLAGQRNKLQERINRLTHDVYASRRERDAAAAEVSRLQSELEAIKAAPVAPTTPAEAPPRAKPRSDEVGPGLKYATYEDYVEDLSDWKAEQRVAQVEARLSSRLEQERLNQQQQVETQRQAAAVSDFTTRAAEFAKDHPDYTEVVSSAEDLVAPPMMYAHLIRSELGPALTYHFAQNPNDFQRIAKMQAGPMLIALGKLEAKLESAKVQPESKPKAEAAPPPPPVTKAPPPPAPVGSTRVTPTVEPDPTGSNFREWANARNEELRRRHQRL